MLAAREETFYFLPGLTFENVNRVLLHCLGTTPEYTWWVVEPCTAYGFSDIEPFYNIREKVEIRRRKDDKSTKHFREKEVQTKDSSRKEFIVNVLIAIKRCRLKTFPVRNSWLVFCCKVMQLAVNKRVGHRKKEHFLANPSG